LALAQGVLELTLGEENEEEAEEEIVQDNPARWSLCELCNDHYPLSLEWPIDGMCPQHEANGTVTVNWRDTPDRNLLEWDFEPLEPSGFSGISRGAFRPVFYGTPLPTLMSRS
jgi:hypothetical protein